MTGKFISGLILLVLVAGCSSSQQKTLKHKRTSARVEYAPEWFNNPPAGKANLFAVSTARSTHADYAIKKGLQNAYAEMSRIIQSHLNGVVLNLVEEYGDKYYSQIHDASQLISKNSLAGIRIVKQEIYHDAPYYYSFFLAAIPVSGINNSMKEQLNEITDLKGRVNFSKTLTAIDNGSDDLLKLVNLHQVSGKYKYPRWFLENTDNWVVGYAPKAYYKENAAADALENGIWNYLLMTENKIKGSMSNVLAAEQDFLASDDLHEQVDSSRYESVLNSLHVQDTVYVNDICLVLLGKGSGDVESGFKRIDQIPEWVINIPAEKNDAYAVGIAPVYHQEKSSWLEAEADGRKKLALRQQLQIESLMMKEGRKFEEVNRININAFIRNAQVMARFRNKYMVFVLIKMPLNS